VSIVVRLLPTIVIACFAFSARAEVVGFQAWKANRVEEARAGLEKLQNDKTVPPLATVPKQSQGAKSESRLQVSQKSVRSDFKIQQAQTNLELARELTVNDYFVLYLSQFKSRDAFVEAAKKLSSEETADLMMSYQKHLSSGGGAYDDIMPSAAGLAAPPANKASTF